MSGDSRQSCRVVLRSNYLSTTIAREVESESEEQVYVLYIDWRGNRASDKPIISYEFAFLVMTEVLRSQSRDLFCASQCTI